MPIFNKKLSPIYDGGELQKNISNFGYYIKYPKAKNQTNVSEN